jgi:hypothetical protein
MRPYYIPVRKNKNKKEMEQNQILIKMRSNKNIHSLLATMQNNTNSLKENLKVLYSF